MLDSLRRAETAPAGGLPDMLPGALRGAAAADGPAEPRREQPRLDARGPVGEAARRAPSRNGGGAGSAREGAGALGGVTRSGRAPQRPAAWSMDGAVGSAALPAQALAAGKRGAVGAAANVPVAGCDSQLAPPQHADGCKAEGAAPGRAAAGVGLQPSEAQGLVGRSASDGAARPAAAAAAAGGMGEGGERCSAAVKGKAACAAGSAVAQSGRADGAAAPGSGRPARSQSWSWTGRDSGPPVHGHGMQEARPANT